MNYYNLYQQNIWNIINTFNLKYFWLKISENFFNGIKNSPPYIFNTPDPWLKKFSLDKTLLAEDILNKGTFTPIFYYNINNQRYILLGKHRVYSLKFYEILNASISKNFLFIEINQPVNLNKKLWYYSNDFKTPCLVSINSEKDLINILTETGDALTPYLWKNNCEPFPPFNDEKLFEEWLNGPEPTIN